jgi:hypothetical protein
MRGVNFSTAHGPVRVSPAGPHSVTSAGQKIRLPFQSLSSRQWVNLGLAAVATLCVIYTALTIYGHGVFDYVGVDFRSFFASGQIANSYGLAQVYNLDLQDRVQLPIYETYATGPWKYPYLTVPTPFLPLFILPLQALSFLAPLPGYIAWSVLNLVILIAYLARFSRSIPRTHRPRFILAGLISFPVFWTLFFGQVNAFLVVCLGEFTLCMLHQQDFRAGFWLSGLLLKPQTVVLLIPGMLVGRRGGAVLGFAAGAGIVALGSTLASGAVGLRNLAGLFLQQGTGLPAYAANTMANWRSAVLAIPGLASTPVGTWITVIGLTLTCAVALMLWRMPRRPDVRQEVVLLAGTLAATFAVAWHSHVHVAAPLVLLLLLAEEQGTLPSGMIGLWLIGPPFVFMAVAFSHGPQPAHQWLGVFMFFLNLVILGWSARVLHRNRAFAARALA